MKEVYRSQHLIVPSQVTHNEPHDPDPLAPDYPPLLPDYPPLLPEDPVVQISAKKVLKYVLNEVKLKLEHGHSISVAEDHLRNAADMLGGHQIPTKWTEVLSLMKRLGYNDPKHYKVCASPDHSCLLPDHDTTSGCPKCKKPWSECIDYYCLGLNFRDWFLTEQQCEQLMAHWRDRSEWMSETACTDVVQTELWHGERFKELSWFWNPDKQYTLPELCPYCRAVIPSTVIEGGTPIIECQKCDKEFACYPRSVRGDPRNQAIIIHEDGWCSFSTSSRSSIAAITITHACMSKAERSDAQNARMYSFIPVSQLPREAPHKYDAFFEPLIQERGSFH